MQLKVYRRDNRKRDATSWRTRGYYAGVACGLLVLALALYWLSGPVAVAGGDLRAFIVENRYFALREIQVRGTDKLSGDEVAVLTGLRQGMNIWNVETAAIGKKIAKHPWVRRVVVHRDFPRRIVIDVEERSPKAIVTARKLYYLDADGVVFKEVEPGESVRYPMLTGISAEALMSGEPATRKRTQEALRLADLMARRSHMLSEIHFAAPDRLVVYTTEFPVALHLGWGDWEQKLGRLEQLLTLWKSKETRWASLDMSFRDQVVGRLKPIKQ